MLAEIARFWVSRAEFDNTKGRYVIRGVIGPDEFHSATRPAILTGGQQRLHQRHGGVGDRARLDALDALPLRDRLDLMETLGIPGPRTRPLGRGQPGTCTCRSTGA